MLATLLSVAARRAAMPARSLVRRGACTMVATTRTTFSAADFPAEWPYSDDDFSRLDEQPDIQFYSAPRFVTHIDDGAIATLTQFYDEELSAGADVLDICSSWISHLPQCSMLRSHRGAVVTAPQPGTVSAMVVLQRLYCMHPRRGGSSPRGSTHGTRQAPEEPWCNTWHPYRAPWHSQARQAARQGGGSGDERARAGEERAAHRVHPS